MLDSSIAIESTDGVTFVLTVHNTGDDPVEITFPDACLAEFVVSSDDDEQWRYSDGRMFAQMVQTQTIAPDDALTIRANWDSPTPGAYTVRSWLTGDVDCSAESEFRVPA
ncbi:BsuPI-related putative proteinase inhibitor [Halocatena halophila]|uniref:BsuPI-related putative proteinase inhibitor n=1 Tax=Halocatena halophila TaxID=2814576 RepID=UPI002ED2314F